MDNEENINNAENSENIEIIQETEAFDDTKANDDTQEQKNDLVPEHTHWEEINSDNEVIKRYIVCVEKDFIPLMDKMNNDERNEYINDAIQKKIDLQNEHKQKIKKRNLKIHFLIVALTIIFVTPLALLIVNKAVMITFANYEYSQNNFERLYKQHFEKNKAFSRYMEYNKELEKKNNKNAAN